jgi:hypothetical protein
MTTTLAEQLQGVLDDVWKLRPSWERPELFHLQKSEAIGRLKALIADAGNGTQLRKPVPRPESTALSLPPAALVPPESPPVPSAPLDPPPPVLELSEVRQAADDLISALERLAASTRVAIVAHTPALPVQSIPIPASPPAPISDPASSPVSELPPSPPPLEFGRYPRTALKTEQGQRLAAQLWLDGHLLRLIGSHFSCPSNAAVYACQAITALLDRRCGKAARATGDRKVLVRQVLECAI